MSNNNLTYTVINVSDITPSILNDCLETNIHTLARSVDGTQSILKWKGDPPSWVVTLGLSTYTNSEIRILIKTTPWLPAGSGGLTIYSILPFLHTIYLRQLLLLGDLNVIINVRTSRHRRASP